jgi:diguanylate cyclase (GGDEF)-like protein/PAS domain S-box-containing protein
MKPISFVVLSVILACSAAPLAGADEQLGKRTSYRIGVLAHEGEKKAAQHWSAHGRYLSRQLTPLRFDIVPLGFLQLLEAVRSRKVDFVITNPAQYTELELEGQVSRIATLRKAGPLGVLDNFGGTVLTRSDRTDLEQYTDLVGKTLLIPSTESLGGWQVHLREALAQGIDLRSEARVVEVKNHRKVVHAIIGGKADAGFVRTGLIEDMVADGELGFDQIRIVNPRNEPDFPYLLSTRLYPEWPIARVTGTPRTISVKVLQALLAMQPNDVVAKEAHIRGWTLPGHYSSVNYLFQETHLGPYAKQKLTLRDILNRYTWEIFSLVGGAVILLLINTVYITRANRKSTQANRKLVREIEERKRAEEKIHILFKAVEQSPVSVMITNARGEIQLVNSAFESLTGYSAEEVLDKSPTTMFSSDGGGDYCAELWNALKSGTPWEGEFKNRRKNGETYWEMAYLSPLRDEFGRIQHFLVVEEDVTVRKQQEDRILHQAHFDSLTSLPNRLLSLDRLSQLLKEADRHGNRTGVLFVDLDDFKKINDTLGHEAGDKLLFEASNRLQSAVRQTDTVGRLGGDEFIILLGGVKEAPNVSLVAENLLKQFRDPFLIDEHEIVLTASIGIALYPGDGDSPSELLRNADLAMYHSKNAGRNTYSWFNEGMNRGISRRLYLEEQMRGALEREEFDVYYQPKINLATGSCIGAEALVRWHSRVLGAVPPAEFVPIAEQTGFIEPLGKFVMARALAATARWRRNYAPDFRIAINLSPRQFRDPKLIDFVEDMIDQAHLPPTALEFEITEGVLLDGSIRVKSALIILTEMGIGMAMDDFGTGYSSLNYLRSYPFDVLKIDRSFISNMDSEEKDRELIAATIVMAHSLGLRVVAEGVETEEQFSLLREADCDLVQGYLLGRPMAEKEFEQRLADRHVENWRRTG